MEDDRVNQTNDPHISPFAEKKPDTQPIHVVIVPASLSVGNHHKLLKDNIISEPIMNYSSHSTATQTRAKPVRLVLMPAPSKTVQKHPCTSATKKSEREVLLLPHSVVKQHKSASSQLYFTNQPAKKVQVLSVVKGGRLTGGSTQAAEYYTATHVDASDSQSVLQTMSSEDDQQSSLPNSVRGTDMEALQKSDFIFKQKDSPSVSPVQGAFLSKEGQNTCMSGAESELGKTQSSHFYASQSGEASTCLSGKSLPAEDQQCENMYVSKHPRLKEEYVCDHHNNRPGMVPSHLIVMTVSPKEINYRIKAFLARKRAELDIQNVEEYCLHIGMNTNVCARVDATVHQHRKRKKRKFEFAPQPEEKADGTHFMITDASRDELPLSVAHPILEERVANVEDHLRLGKSVPKEIYSRLKRIEDRILRLEGISPEYTYDATVNLHPPRTLPKIKRRCTIDELDGKIVELQKKFDNKKAGTSSQEQLVQ